MSASFDTDVAIVGYGPTGAMLANLLAARGWRVEVFEREHGVFHQPRAVHFDAEIMRLFQQAGLADAIHNAVTPVRGMDLFNGAGTLIFQYRPGNGPGPLGWQDGYMFYQPDLERALRIGVTRFPTATAHLGHDVRAIGAYDEGARLDVRGPDGARQVTARLAVGCCGARSITRASMGSSLFDYGFEQPWLVLDLVLRRPLDLPDVTVQYCEPARPSTYVVMPGARRRFEIMLMPGDVRDEMTSPPVVRSLLARWIPEDAYDIERAAVYAFHCLVADRWRSGSLMIAGDAVHQMPPFLGQGMCSGLRDAANLAWKVDLVLAGKAAPSLLDTYQPEREPHVRKIIETDMYLGSIIQTTDTSVAAARDAQATAAGGPSSLTPPDYPIGGDLCGTRDGDRLPFPQPRLEDGRLHDELLGNGFALVGGVTPSGWARDVLRRVGVRHVENAAPAIAAWLGARGARAALVRPDRNVLAVVGDTAELDAALAPLASHLV